MGVDPVFLLLEAVHCFPCFWPWPELALAYFSHMVGTVLLRWAEALWKQLRQMSFPFFSRNPFPWLFIWLCSRPLGVCLRIMSSEKPLLFCNHKYFLRTLGKIHQGPFLFYSYLKSQYLVCGFWHITDTQWMMMIHYHGDHLCEYDWKHRPQYRCHHISALPKLSYEFHSVYVPVELHILNFFVCISFLFNFVFY